VPQNIVVLSDGTGNAAASIWRTNVWRVFKGIDLTKSERLVQKVLARGFLPLFMNAFYRHNHGTAVTQKDKR
jgi:hypothetical protein